MLRPFLRAIPALLLLFVHALSGQEFLHPSDVVKKMKENFKTMKSYEANFTIVVKDNKDSKTSSGVARYKSGGKLNFTFRDPSGDWIISDGKKMWVYVASLRAVGVQDLKKSQNGKPVYDTGSYEGLVRLFERYHYRFSSPDQPVSENNGKYFLLTLSEKTASGGYETLELKVNASTYLIESMKGVSPSGRIVEMTFSSIQVNPDLQDNLFQYSPKDGVKVVENPLTTE